MPTVGTIAWGGSCRHLYSFFVTDLKVYDNKKKLFTSGWFDWYMILIPSDQWFANNVDFSKNEKLSRIFKILLKCSFQFNFRQFFTRNLSKSYQISLSSWGFKWWKIGDFIAWSTSHDSERKNNIVQIFLVINIFESIALRLFALGTVKNEYFKLVNWSREIGSGEAISFAIQRSGFRDLKVGDST